MGTLILDVGKTHVKLHLLDAHLHRVFSQQADNRVVYKAPYPHYDIDRLWQWLLAAMSEAASRHPVSAISLTAHGAAAALIDRTRGDSGLVLPILDYESDAPREYDAAYAAVRPTFGQTFSPDLPFGLNLGRQLFWQQNRFPDAFGQATDILLYPQYWVWRLSGQCCAEVTSLGCHTDMWAPAQRDYSSLVDSQGWRDRLPALVPAWTRVGRLRPELCAQTGIGEGCKVFAGIHDSNASFLRYKRLYGNAPFTVISTGTWSIVMAAGVSPETLKPDRDLLANVDVTGEPVACSRAMGGREYAQICQRTATSPDAGVTTDDLQQLIDSRTLALPDFSGGSGPFPARPHPGGAILGNPAPGLGAALATLYGALMLDYQMDLVQARGEVFIEGAFLKNPALCGLLAQLRGPQRIRLSSDATGTLQGCALLTRWQARDTPIALADCPASSLRGLDAYRKQWRDAAESCQASPDF